MERKCRVCTKRRLIQILVAIVTCIVLVYVGTLLTTKCVEKQESRCTTNDCLEASAYYKWSMDTSVNPCEDFYEFTCGQWNSDRNNKSVFQRSQNKILLLAEKLFKAKIEDNDFYPVKQTKILYRSCMNPDYEMESNRDLYIKHLEHLDIPVIPQYFNVTHSEVKFDFLDFEQNLFNSFSTFSCFIISTMILDNTVLELSLRSQNKGSLHEFQSRDYIIEDTEFSGDDSEGSGDQLLNGMPVASGDNEIDDFLVRKKFENVLSNHFLLNIETKIQDTLEKLKFSTTLNKITEAAEVIHSIQMKIESVKKSFQSNKFYTIKTLEENFEVVLLKENIQVTETWTKFIKMILQIVKTDFKDASRIQINLSRINDLFLIFGSIKNVDRELYMWQAAISEIEYTYAKLQRFSPFRLSVQNCTRLVNEFMGSAVSYGLSNILYNEVTRVKVDQMINKIQNAHHEVIKRNVWMDPLNRQKVLQKSKNMSRVIGLSTITKDSKILENLYKSIQLSQNDFIGNIFDIFILIFHGNINQFQIGTAKSNILVNAHFDTNENSINIPMAILHQPIYGMGLEVLNYGALGSIIGHEINHGFNYEEILKYDTFESLELKRKLNCFTSQYEQNYGNTRISMLLASIFTQPENVADTSGINLAFAAYKELQNNELELPGFENYTQDQLFFIAYANVWCGEIGIPKSIFNTHSTNRYRVQATLQNSKHFANSFKCPLGSRMNPNRSRCNLFD